MRVIFQGTGQEGLSILKAGWDNSEDGPVEWGWTQS